MTSIFQPNDIYLSTRKRGEMLMAHDDLRITGDELKRRMSADEELIVLDSSNPQAWAGATEQSSRRHSRRSPRRRRGSAQTLTEEAHCCVLHLTERRLKRQF